MARTRKQATDAILSECRDFLKNDDEQTIEQRLRDLVAAGHAIEDPDRPGYFCLTDEGRKYVETNLLPPELKPD